MSYYGHIVKATEFSDQLIPDRGKFSYHKICELDTPNEVIYCRKSNPRIGAPNVYLYKASFLPKDQGISLTRQPYKDLKEKCGNFGNETSPVKWHHLVQIDSFKESIKKIPLMSLFICGYEIKVRRDKDMRYVVSSYGICKSGGGPGWEGIGLSIEDAYSAMWINFLRASGLDILGVGKFAHWQNRKLLNIDL